jgi:hypothetical protein
MGSRGITRHWENRSDVVQVVGRVHSSDDGGAYEPWQQRGGQNPASEGTLVCRKQDSLIWTMLSDAGQGTAAIATLLLLMQSLVEVKPGEKRTVRLVRR